MGWERGNGLQCETDTSLVWFVMVMATDLQVLERMLERIVDFAWEMIMGRTMCKIVADMGTHVH